MIRFLTLGLLLLCPACIQLGSDPAPMHFYLLQPDAAAQPLPLESAVTVSLAPIHLPAYLDRLQLTTRGDQQQVLIAGLERWAEPLDQGLTRVLTENLARYLSDGRENAALRQTIAARKILLKLTINSFDGILGQSTSVDIRWSIVRPGPLEQVLSGHFVENKPLGKSHADLVLGLNRALDRFSYSLALAIAQQH